MLSLLPLLYVASILHKSIELKENEWENKYVGWFSYQGWDII